MRIRIESDLHIEFVDKFLLEVTEDEENTILILAGDICLLSKINKFEYFFKDCCQRFEKVLYVLGNHEFYKGSIKDYKKYLNQLEFDNLHILDCNYIDIENYRFIGTTLWTDFNKRDPLTMYYAKQALNDFKQIRSGSIEVPYLKKFTPIDAANEFEKNVNFIKNSFDTEKINIVITHHSPCQKSVHYKYKNEIYTNYCYYSDLTPLIEEYKPTLWIHGHLHDACQYTIYDTTVISNPHGYPNENKKYMPKVIEV